MQDFLAAHPALETLVPLDATIVFPRLSGVADTTAFAERAARVHGVTVVPGRFFDAPAHLRLSVAGATANLTGGLARLADALNLDPR
jgi:aspartate/methionine/tyrosine aminotransferase